MNIILSGPITKGEAAIKLGLDVYDCALPQPWVDQVKRVTDTDMDEIKSSFVWCYDEGSCLGYPYPLTVGAYGLLKTYDNKVGTRLSDETLRPFTVLQIE